jgi:hypothetical protein
MNPKVHFNLINVVENIEDSNELLNQVSLSKVSNFHVTVVSFTDFSVLVKEKLGISVEFNHSWGYKVGIDYLSIYLSIESC